MLVLLGGKQTAGWGKISTFNGKFSSTLSDFPQESDLLSKKVLISHSCFFAVELNCKYQAQEEQEHSQINEK